MVGLSEINQAREAIQPHIHRTPTHRSETLDRDLDLRLDFKLELFQRTGSFKIRGVMNKLSRLSAEEREKGVVSMSSGNHAQALSCGAAAFGIPATIVMPSWSRQGKIDATRSYGGEIILTEDDLMLTCRRIMDERGLTFVHPFDDAHVIAGHGTLGLEILEDSPEPDYVLVSVGGGGLISGVATAVAINSPATKIIGIEPEGAPAMSRSLDRGTAVHLDSVDTIADGLAAPFAGEICLDLVQRYVDRVVLVSDREIVRSMALIMERLKVVPEPAAATALAPIVSGTLKLPPDSRTVCVLCGGNVDSETLSELFRPETQSMEVTS